MHHIRSIRSIPVALVLVFFVFSYSVLVPFAGADEFFFADSLGVDNATGYKNTFVIVPVNITNTHDNIIAIEFTIQYDKNVIEFIDAYKGELTSGENWSKRVNKSTGKIGMAGSILQPIPVNSSGSVVLLNFSVLGEPGAMTWLNITNITLVNSTWVSSTATPKNGTFMVAGAQAWYLHKNRVMYRGNLSIPVDTVIISPGNNITWVANEPALVDAAFRAGRWTGWLILNEPFPGDNFTAEIGSYNCSNNNFSTAGSQNFTGAAGTDKTMFEVNIQASAFMVPEGDYLAFRISNPTCNGNDIVVQTGKSFITSPESDPGYPVPELHTVMLFFFGLLTLIAYYMLWNRSSRGHR